MQQSTYTAECTPVLNTHINRSGGFTAARDCHDWLATAAVDCHDWAPYLHPQHGHALQLRLVDVNLLDTGPKV
jgi:hypothetical protein